MSKSSHSNVLTSLISDNSSFLNSNFNLTLNSISPIETPKIKGTEFFQGIKIAHANVNRLKTHFSIVESYITDNMIDIFAVTETFLTELDDSSIISVDHYNFYRLDRVGKVGGGVGFYTRDFLRVNILSHSDPLFNNTAEFIIAEISIDSEKLLFAVVYLRPKALFPDEFFESLSNMLPSYKNVVITGDFNINLMNNNYTADTFRSTVDSFALFLVPSEPTHHTLTAEYSSHTWIDLFIINDESSLQSYTKSSAPFIARHDVISISFRAFKPQNTSRNFLFKDFKNLNCDILNNLVSQNLSINSQGSHSLFDCNLNSSHIDNLASRLSSVLVSSFDICSPLKSCQLNIRKKPWVSADIRKKMHERDRAYKAAARSGSSLAIARYRRLRGEVSNSLDTAKNTYIANRLSSSANSANRWSILHKIGLSNKVLPSPLQYFSSRALLTHYTAISSLSSPLNNNEINEVLAIPLRHDLPTFEFTQVDQSSVKSIINLASSKSVGPDGLSADMLKFSQNSLVPHLTDLINLSLTSGSFPASWKRAYFLPLAKSSKLDSLSQTRPIAKLCEISKVLERVVHIQLYTHIESHSLLNNLQTGFRKSNSTQTALLKLLEDTRLAIDKRMITLLLLFDFSKAFDTVPHARLLRKLRSVNCSDAVIRWFASYLRDRSYAVPDAGGAVGDWMSCSAGVPQGSVLGPLLFSVYINDLPLVLNNAQHILFADDLQVYHSFLPSMLNEEISFLNHEVASVVKWAKDNHLTLNPSKMQAIFLGSEQYIARIDSSTCPSIFVNNIPIPYSSVVKNLGVWITSTLNWNKQVNSVIGRIYGTLQSLKFHKHALSKCLRKELVEALIFPIIDYCCIVYDDIPQTLNIKLHRALNAAVRFVFGNIGRCERVTPFRLELGWLSVQNRRLYFKATLAHSIVTYQNPSYLSSKFRRANIDTVVRSSSRLPQRLLICPVVRTAAMLNSFVYSSSTFINNNVDLFVDFEAGRTQVIKHHLYARLLGEERAEWHGAMVTR